MYKKFMDKRIFTQTFGVVGAIIEKDGKILLVKEGEKDKAVFGMWSHPAGWIDLGEDTIEAARREVLEETGHEFTPKNVLGIYCLVKKEWPDIHHPVKIIFTGVISNEKVRELESDVSETKWFTPEEIENMGPETLRDLDIKQMIKDYFSGKKYPLDIITYTVSK